MKNEKGYTIIHALLTLFAFMLIASCLPPLLKGVTIMEKKLDPSKEYEWNLFSHQFREELRGAEGMKVTGTSVIFYKDGEEILYELYGDFLRRRVDRRGHELVLGPLTTVKFSPCRSGVEISAGFTEGFQATGRFFTYGQ
ncbi:competence type IV pilus minor pilin ComGF [Bacillus sp. AK031]